MFRNSGGNVVDLIRSTGLVNITHELVDGLGILLVPSHNVIMSEIKTGGVGRLMFEVNFDVAFALKVRGTYAMRRRVVMK